MGGEGSFIDVNEPVSIHGVVDHHTVVIAAVVDEADLIAQRGWNEIRYRSPDVRLFIYVH